MGEEGNVLDIIVGSYSTTAFVQLPLLQGLMRVDTLQDTQPPGGRKRKTVTGKQHARKLFYNCQKNTED